MHTCCCLGLCQFLWDDVSWSCNFSCSVFDLSDSLNPSQHPLQRIAQSLPSVHLWVFLLVYIGCWVKHLIFHLCQTPFCNYRQLSLIVSVVVSLSDGIGHNLVSHSLGFLFHFISEQPVCRTSCGSKFLWLGWCLHSSIVNHFIGERYLRPHIMYWRES